IGITALSSIDGSAFVKANYDFDWTVWAPPSAADGNGPAYYPQLYGVSGVVGVAYDDATVTYGDALPSSTLYGIGYFNRWTTLPSELNFPRPPNVGNHVLASTGAAASFTPGGASRIVYLPGMLTVTPRAITVTAEGGQSVYGDTPTDPGLSADNLAPGETVSMLTGLFNSFGIAATTAAGQYGMTVEGVLSNTNYQISNGIGGMWSVTPRPITLTADDFRKRLGAPDPALSWALTGGSLASHDTASAVFSGNLRRAPGELPGVYSIGQGSLLANANYTLTVLPGRFSIDPVAITSASTGEQADAPEQAATTPGGDTLELCRAGVLLASACQAYVHPANRGLDFMSFSQ
ncbi:MAG TPA: MBG domain-containing protein, partial [Devosia sp.]|nr:MBG domain-containing protein [Devosia sp.]